LIRPAPHGNFAIEIIYPSKPMFTFKNTIKFQAMRTMLNYQIAAACLRNINAPVFLFIILTIFQACKEPDQTEMPKPDSAGNQGTTTAELTSFLAEVTGALPAGIAYNEAEKTFVIDEDMEVSRENAEKQYVDEKTSRVTQRRGQWLLTGSSVKDVKVYILPTVPDTWKTAVRAAIPEWNKVTDTQARFREVPSVVMADVIVKPEYDKPDEDEKKHWVARQALPNYLGQVGGGMTVNTYYSAQSMLSASEKKFAAIHELGHSIGLMHTDKHTDGFVDFQVCGTPSMDSKSVMNSVVDIWGGFSTYDLLAVRILYPAHTWQQLPGSARDVAAGSNTKTLWIVGNTPVPGGYSIHKYDYNAKKFVQYPGGATRIAIGKDGEPWIINNIGLVYRRLSSSIWQEQTVVASDIAVGGNGQVYVVSKEARAGGYAVSYLKNGQWLDVPGRGATKIAVTPQGIPWAVDNAGKVLRLAAGGFEEVTGSGRDIAVGNDGMIYVISNVAVSGGYSIQKWMGSCWVQVSGGGVAISSNGANGGPVVINDQGKIFQY